jgi:hypothetical protein
MKTRLLPLVFGLSIVVAIVASGCASSSPSNRSAAGASTASKSLSESDLNEFCAPPRDSNEKPGFEWVRNIVTCFVLQNETKTFSAPNKLDEKTPLTVTRAFCSGSTDVCVNETGYYGDIRTEGLGKTYGWRSLTPNPFTGLAAMQFMPNKIWQGAINRIFVTSSSAPFSLQQTAAQPYFYNPSSGSNDGNCDTQGSFIGCSLDGGSWQRDGTEQRPRYTFFTKPMRITINNNSGSPMTASSQASPGRGFLLDPVAQANLESIPTGGQAFIGGYRSTNSNDEQSWTASYCVDYKPTGSTAAPTCIPVDITVKLAYIDNKWVNQSQCVVNARTAAVTIKCDQPTMNDSDTDRIVTINVKNF